MKKRRWLQSHQSRQFALRCGLFLVCLLLVAVLPKGGSSVVGAIGLTYGLIKYCEWGNDPKGFPKWGCFLHARMPPLEFREDWERSLTAEQKTQLAAMMEKQTLLRATEMEKEPEQELLRPATDAKKEKSEELLRSSDEPGEKDRTSEPTPENKS